MTRKKKNGLVGAPTPNKAGSETTPLKSAVPNGIQHPAGAAVNHAQPANARTRRARRLAPHRATSEPDWVMISARRVSQRTVKPSREVFEVTVSDLNNEGAVAKVRVERSENRHGGAR
jgi:hypothetical protein